MRILVVSVLALAACGGSSPEWAGKWKQAAGFPAGTYLEATLGGSGHTITGTGIQHREAGTDLTFTVQGIAAPTPGPSLTLTYQDGSSEGFTFAQPDPNHLTWSNAQRTVNLLRQ
jgi:hypothetical protein